MGWYTLLINGMFLTVKFEGEGELSEQLEKEKTLEFKWPLMLQSQIVPDEKGKTAAVQMGITPFYPFHKEDKITINAKNIRGYMEVGETDAEKIENFVESKRIIHGQPGDVPPCPPGQGPLEHIG